MIVVLIVNNSTPKKPKEKSYPSKRLSYVFSTLRKSNSPNFVCIPKTNLAHQPRIIPPYPFVLSLSEPHTRFISSQQAYSIISYHDYLTNSPFINPLVSSYKQLPPPVRGTKIKSKCTCNFRLIGVLRAFVNKPFFENFDTIFMKNIKSYQENSYFFFSFLFLRVSKINF